MNSRLLFLLLLLIAWVVIGLLVCRKYLCGSTPAVAAAPAAVVDDTCPLNWKALDGNLFNTGDVCNNFKFRKSSFALSSGFENDLTTAISGVQGHMTKNEDRGMTITGYYYADEENPSVLDNIGLARANSIKSLFTSKGIAANRITLASKLANRDWLRNDSLLMGSMITFGDIANSDDRLAAIKSRLFGKPITLYFGTDQDNISLSSQQRTDMTDLIYYLDNVTGAKLNVDGHTDSVGNRDYNVNLSQERATFVKNYLQRNGGIALNRMDVQGYGPDKPVQSNGTEAGRAKNRRVEVTLN